MTRQTFKIEKTKATIEGVAFAKSDTGGLVKRLRVVFDATDKRHAGALDQRWPRASEMILGIAASEGESEERKGRKRLGTVNLKLWDPSGTVQIFDFIGVKALAPTLRVAPKAKSTSVVVDVFVPVPKDKAKDLDDFYRAEMLAELESTQSDLEDAAKDAKAAKKGKGKKKKKAEQVELRVIPGGHDVVVSSVDAVVAAAAAGQPATPPAAS